ncbi:MAG: hypothetical protein M5U26_20645 [Planctomycetota bacterium]|nr:hypothetical protein [Planctomycetota bacterium]
MIRAKSSSRFTYRLSDDQGLDLGVLKMPDYIAAPRKGWTESLVPDGFKDHVKIVLGPQSYRVEFEVLSGLAMKSRQLRFFLMEGERTIAATRAHAFRSDPWELESGGQDYRLSRAGGLFSPMCFELSRGPEKVGRIVDTTGFSLWSRTFEIDLPDELDRAVQVFLFFLAVNTAFR